MTIGLKDVAARAGVSIKTVSNVVNGQRVLPETQRRVQEAIDHLGYRPNLSARSLRQGRTGVIALAIPDLASPYFADVATSVISAADARGWTVLVDETGGNRERELLVLEGIRSPLIDGAIFSPLVLGSDDLAARNRQVPLVLIGERLPADAVDHVTIDNVAAAATAVEHLLAGGRRRVALIGAQPPTSATARLRLDGWRQALRAAGLPEEPTLIQPEDTWTRLGGYTAARELLARDARPDALFCCNDLLAVGALRALREAGLRVPDDVAVVGVDDIEETRFTAPPLTTIAPDKSRIATRSVDLLALRIDEARARPAGGEAAGPHAELVDFSLVVRGSS